MLDQGPTTMRTITPTIQIFSISFYLNNLLLIEWFFRLICIRDLLDIEIQWV
jgi:hypothetical protein